MYISCQSCYVWGPSLRKGGSECRQIGLEWRDLNAKWSIKIPKPSASMTVLFESLDRYVSYT